MKKCNKCGSTNVKYEGCGSDMCGFYKEYTCNDCGETIIIRQG